MPCAVLLTAAYWQREGMIMLFDFGIYKTTLFHTEGITASDGLASLLGPTFQFPCRFSISFLTASSLASAAQHKLVPKIVSRLPVAWWVSILG